LPDNLDTLNDGIAGLVGEFEEWYMGLIEIYDKILISDIT
jgi:hypothetical protein